MTKEERKQEFIRKALLIHKDENLDYSQIDYINNRTPVKIIDHDLRLDGIEYGEFWQTPSNHLKGQMHPDKRGNRISKSKQLTQEEIIKRFKEVHLNENLDYSQVVYKGMHAKVKIISHDLRPDGSEYGEFWQEPVVHLKGCTHPEIGRQNQIIKQTSTTEEFIAKGKIIHANNNYSYQFVDYINNRIKVKIFCNKLDAKGQPHGMFEISPDNFLHGKGCPKCGNHLSNGENEIADFIGNLIGKNNIIRGDHSVLNSNELDIYIPEKKLAFEFNGLRWHSEQFNKGKYYHLNKTKLCEEKRIHLIHIFEDDFLFNKRIIFSYIKHILSIKLSKIDDDFLIIKTINKDIAKSFLNSNCLKKYCKSTYHIGAYYNGELIFVTSLVKKKNDVWYIVRSCGNYNYEYRGFSRKNQKYLQKKSLN